MEIHVLQEIHVTVPDYIVISTGIVKLIVLTETTYLIN